MISHTKKLALNVLASCLSIACCANAQEWKRLEDLDPMTDERRVAIAAGSTFAPSCSVTRELAVLQFQCENNKMTAAVTAPGCVLEDDRSFDYRVDKNKANFLTTKSGSDPSVAYLYHGFDYEEPRKLFLELLQAQSVIIQIEPFAMQPEIVTFDLTRMAEYVGKDFDSCLPTGVKTESLVKKTPKNEPQDSTVPSLSEEIKDQLKCEQSPRPGSILGRMRNDGLIDTTKNIGFDSLSCFEIKGGLTVDGMMFSHVCGFEEDENMRNLYPDIFYRSPGTSPGQTIELFTDADEMSVEQWLTSTTGAEKSERQVSSDFVEFAQTSVGCSSWITR